MADIATLGIKVTTQGVDNARRDLGGLEQQGRRTEEATHRMAGAFGTLKTAIAALGVGVAVREFVQAADQMSLLNARLKLSTASVQEFSAAQRQLFALAQQNSVGLAETIQLYTRLADPIKRVGGGMTEVIGITDTFQKALQLGGVTAQEAAAATLQFGQALGRGALSGDEFNSIAEASPRILKAIADGANLPIEKLKQLGAEGKLTSDVIGNALLNVRSQVSQEFASLPDTVGKATERMKNDFLAMAGEINEAGNFTAGMAEALDGLRALIPPIRDELIDAAEQYAAWWERNSAEMGVVFDHVTGIVGQVWDLARAAAQVAGTIAEWALQSGAVSTVLETLQVLAVNIAYIFQQIGNELGGMAAQAAAILRLDFSGAASIGEMMREDAAKARAEVDALSERILNTRKSALEAKTAIAGVSGEAAKAEPVFKKLAGSSAATADAKKKVKAASDDYARHLREELTKAIETAAKAQDDLTRRYADALGPLEEQALQLKKENEFYGMTEAQIAAVNVQRYAEVRALAAQNGASADYLKTLDLQIDAMQEIADELSKRETNNAATKAAEKAAQEWERTAQTIEQSLTDALMRGFESGENFAENFRNTLKNMFATLVLRPIIQPIAQGMSSVVLGALGMGGGSGGGGSNIFGMAQNASSLYSNGSLAAQYFGGTMSGANAMGTAYANATGTGLDGLVGATGGWGTAPYGTAGNMPGMGTYGAGLAGALWAYNQTGSYTAGVAGGAAGMAASGAIAGGVGAAAAGTSVGAGAMAGASAGLAAIPVWGWAALAVMAIAADMMGSKKDPKVALQMAKKGGQFDQKWEDGVKVSSVFGELGLHANSKDVDAGDFRKQLEALAAFDNAMSAFLSEREIESIRERMDGWKSKRVNAKYGAGNQRERLLAITEGIGGDVFADAQSFIDSGKAKGNKGVQAFTQFVLDRVRTDELSGLVGTLGNESLDDDAAMAWMQGLNRTETIRDAKGKKQKVEISGFNEIAAATQQLAAVIGPDSGSALAAQVNAMAEQFSALGKAMPTSADGFRELVAGIDLTTQAGRDLWMQLGPLAEGFGQVMAAQQQLYDMLIPESEKLARAQSDLVKEFADLSQAVPSSAADLRALIDAQDQSTESGRTMRAELLALVPAFLGVQDAAQQAAAQAAAVAAQAAEEAMRQADAVLRERLGLEADLLMLQGDTAELRRRERDALHESNRALYDQIRALEDQQAAAQAAAEAQQRILSERDGLERRMMELNGDTAGLRVRDLALLDESNRALQEQIWARQDEIAAAEKQAAAQALADQQAAAAASAAAAAAERLREAWQSLGETIADEIRRLRGLTDSGGAQGYAALQAQFAIQTAKARAGNQDAAQMLPELSRSLSDMAADIATSSIDLSRMNDATAASLEQTLKAMRRFGVSIPGFAAGGDFSGGMRLVGEQGPEIELTGPSRIFSASQTAGMLNNRELVAEVRALRQEVASLRAANEATARNTHATKRQLERWDGDGMPETRVTA